MLPLQYLFFLFRIVICPPSLPPSYPSFLPSSQTSKPMSLLDSALLPNYFSPLSIISLSYINVASSFLIIIIIITPSLLYLLSTPPFYPQNPRPTHSPDQSINRSSSSSSPCPFSLSLANCFLPFPSYFTIFHHLLATKSPTTHTHTLPIYIKL